MILAELKRIGKLPKSGPMVVWEKTESPYTMAQYRYLWRAMATEAGVPKNVRNITGTRRDANIADEAMPTAVDLCTKVQAVCDAVPADIRDPVINEMVADLLAGEVTFAELEKARSQYVRRHRAAFDTRFRDVSLEQPLSGTEVLRLADVISSEQDLAASEPHHAATGPRRFAEHFLLDQFPPKHRACYRDSQPRAKHAVR
jgi:hypothetical protein